MGNPPRHAIIGDEAHALVYVNPKELSILHSMRKGRKPVIHHGVPAFIGGGDPSGGDSEGAGNTGGGIGEGGATGSGDTSGSDPFGSHGEMGYSGESYGGITDTSFTGTPTSGEPESGGLDISTTGQAKGIFGENPGFSPVST